MLPIIALMGICFVLPGYITLIVPKLIPQVAQRSHLVILMAAYITSIFIVPLLLLQQIMFFEFGDQFFIGILLIMVIFHSLEIHYLNILKILTDQWNSL